MSEELSVATTPNEARAIIDVAREAEQRRLEPVAVDREKLYVVTGFDGTLGVLDLEEYRARPTRKKGAGGVYTAESFGEYVQRHSQPGDDTEATIWADVETRRVVAVLDDHAATAAGWAEHRVTLVLRTTAMWDRWLALDNKLGDQQTFAEHIEDSIPEIVEPDGADLLELAQSFHATSSALFKSDQRLTTGEVKLRFEETVTASAGATGEMSIPQTFVVALEPFEGMSAFRVTARLRYRLREGRLTIGYKLDRPDEVLRAAFDEVLEQIASATGLRVWSGVPRQT